MLDEVKIMRGKILAATGLALTVTSAAFAQSATTPPATAGSMNSSSSDGTMDHGSARQQIMDGLKQSGFSDIKVMADSFLVQANDKSGHPMTMFIGPNSITEVSTMGGSSQSAQSSGGAMFASIPASDDLSSKLVGLDIYNKANQDIGTIKDVAFDHSGVKAYIVGVGGFLGMGEHYVAIRPASLNLTYNTGDKKWHAAMDVSADQLKSAPEYKYAKPS